MSSMIREFNNIAEFVKSIDEDLNDYRKKLAELLRRLEELRVKVEHERKIKTAFTKLGLVAEAPEPKNVVDLKNIKIVMNPTADQELSNLESVVESLNNKITMLTAIKKDLEVLGSLDVEVKLTVIYLEGLPKTLIIKYV
jgi:flagellar biosynthesis chaperone FliJ